MMFQIAHGYAKSIEYNREFILPFDEGDSDHRHLQKTIFKNFNYRIANTYNLKNAKVIKGTNRYKKLIPYDDCPTIFSGYFQTEKYFKNYKYEVIKSFSPTDEFINKAKSDFPFIGESIVVALHYRKENFYVMQQTSPSLTIDYINEALTRLPKYDKLLIISDDINWCKENIKIEGVYFSEKYKDYEDIWLMSLCNHFIISNSSFSWWGSYLSKSKNKVIITPGTWFGPDVIDYPYDIWGDGYIKIPTMYNFEKNSMELKRYSSII